MPSFKSSLTLYLLNYFEWFVCCPVQDLVQSALKCSEVCFRAIHSQFCSIHLVVALHSHQDSFTLLWPRLHPQVQFCHEVPELAFVMAAVPALRYQVTGPVRLGCFCWEPLHGTGDASDCIQSAIDCCVHFFTNSLQEFRNPLSDLLLQRQVC